MTASTTGTPLPSSTWHYQAHEAVLRACAALVAQLGLPGTETYRRVADVQFKIAAGKLKDQEQRYAVISALGPAGHQLQLAQAVWTPGQLANPRVVRPLQNWPKRQVEALLETLGDGYEETSEAIRSHLPTGESEAMTGLQAAGLMDAISKVLQVVVPFCNGSVDKPAEEE